MHFKQYKLGKLQILVEENTYDFYLLMMFECELNCVVKKHFSLANICRNIDFCFILSVNMG